MKTTEVLQNIIKLFESGQVPEAVAHATFPVIKIPANTWSLLNRILLYCANTEDARGFRQWQEVGRYVQKGAKAIHILAPKFKKIEKPVEKEDPTEKLEKTILTGFFSIPVFRVEDTEGEPLEYEKLTLPPLPLMERAKEWGLTVKAVPNNGSWYGSYSPSRAIIQLATPEERTFFHELAHHAHKLILGELKPGQNWRQEVVAELAAQALCYLVGKKPGHSIGNSYHYIASYAKEAFLSPVTVCLKTLNDVEQILSLILKIRQ